MKTLLFTILSSVVVASAQAQGTEEDYKNAFEVYGRYSNKMTNGNVSVHKGHDGGFWYSVFDGDSTVFYSVDGKSGEKTRISDPRPRRHHEWNGNGHHWMEVLDEKDGHEESPTEKNTFIVHKDDNLYLSRSMNADSVYRQLTTDGVPTCYYSSWGKWSKDGKYYATVLIKPAPKRFVTYTLSSPADQVQPKYSQQEYAKPGDSLNYRIPVIVDVENGKTIAPKSCDLFLSQYYVEAPVWDEDGKTVTFEFNERGHKTYRVLEMNLEGDVKTLIEEKNDKYVAYSRNLRRDMNANYILWKSDRDGHAHLYVYDRKKEKLTQLTKGDFWVRDVVAYECDAKGQGYVIFGANGRNCKNMGKVASSLDGSITEEDPYNVHYYRVDLRTKKLTELTPEEGNHKVTYNEESKTLVDTYSTPLNPPVTVLRSAVDGKVVSTLETADITKLRENGWTEPEIFVAPGRDGKTDMWGMIRRPRNFDPTKKYPVIEYIYSGPGDQYVPKSFSPALYYMDALTELGFIVVQLDAMTTSFRSLDFEQVCYKNLKDAGFPDRIAWIKAAAEKYPYMDIERMGIYGCSAGGQEALGALLFHPDFYKVGYSACGCHDNRMDKIWWNEQWMGYPVDESYVECSNVVNAHKLQGKLMLVVGEMDDNVDPSSSYQVVNALQKANKDFEFILLPGARHTMGESYGEHKRYDFFVRNLMGVEPPAWK